MIFEPDNMAQMHANRFTHPGDASLADPLFAARKEGELQILVDF